MARSSQSPIFEFPFVCFLKSLLHKITKLLPKNLLLKMMYLSFLFHQKRNSKIGLWEDLALPVYYTIKKNIITSISSHYDQKPSRVNGMFEKIDFEKNEKQAKKFFEKHDNRPKFSIDKSVKICLFSENPNIFWKRTLQCIFPW